MPGDTLNALDAIDLRILTHLQANARISNARLAEQVGLSPAPCLRRVRALEEAGIIRDYVALLDSRAVGRAVTVFVEIRLDLQVKDRLDILERAIREWPEVLECNLMTGDADYLLRVAVPDVDAYEHFLRDKLTQLEGVASVQSRFALKQVKYTTALPIGSRPDRAPRAGSDTFRGGKTDGPRNARA